MEKRNLVPANSSNSPKIESFKAVKLEEEQTHRVKGGNGEEEEGDDANGIIGESEIIDL